MPNNDAARVSGTEAFDRDWAVPPSSAPNGNVAATPASFADFLIDRATRKPSEHTLKAFRQDFTAVANLLTAGRPRDLTSTDITKDTMRAAFAAYASAHKPASIRRCWSTWNVLCEFLYTAELIPANPMAFVGKPKAAKTLPRSHPQPAVGALLEAVYRDRDSQRCTDWPERDLALILTGLLAGLRPDELRRADVGDIRMRGAVVHGLRHTYATEFQLRSQRVHADEAGSRIDGGLATLCHRGRGRHPPGRRTKSSLRSGSRPPAHGLRVPRGLARPGPRQPRAATAVKSGLLQEPLRS